MFTQKFSTNSFKLSCGGLVLFAVAINLSACAAGSGYSKDDFQIKGNDLYRDNKTFVFQAIHVPDLGKSDGSLPVVGPALARIGEVGGNAICFDLAGFNADGSAIDPAAVQLVETIGTCTKDHWMGALIRVLGDSTDPAFRKKASLTAAKAFKNQYKVVYWFDGPDAGELAKTFKKKAPKTVVAAPENGDIQVLDATPAAMPKNPILIANQIPGPAALRKAHFVLPGKDADYPALDAALTDPVEKAPWEPDNSILSEQERAEGFIALFDGKTLNGWWVKDDNKQGFGVNPAGFIEWKSKGAGALMTRNRYDNFILRMDWMVEKNGNTGVWLHAPRNGRQSRLGFEVQMRGDYDIDPPDKSNTGAIYDVIPPACKAANPDGQWNNLEVICNGPHVKVTLNGKVVQDLSFDDYEPLRHRLRKGFICVTDHGNYCGFRNIRIKPL